MNKRVSPHILTLLALCFIFTFQTQTDKSLSAGFTQLYFKEASDLNVYGYFEQANQLCRREYFERWGTKLGKIIEAHWETSSGTTYKIVYETECQCQWVYFIVYTEYWTNTVKIIDVGNYGA